jgi:Capsular polysaccharide biosynthesis protein
MNHTEGYIDIHAHILPEVDDGSGSMEETVQMLKTALEQGIRTIIATPHFVAGESNTPVEQLYLIRDRVQAEAKKLNEELKIEIGNELYYSKSILDTLKSKEALTLAGSRYLLVEFSVGEKYTEIYKGLSELVRAGYAPILAHVERYFCLYKREDFISELIEMGTYIQMNSSSLIGGIFHSDAAINRKLVKRGLVHFIGSDCHDQKYRVPSMQSAVDALNKKCDNALISNIFYANPKNILENTYV